MFCFQNQTNQRNIKKQTCKSAWALVAVRRFMIRFNTALIHWEKCELGASINPVVIIISLTIWTIDTGLVLNLHCFRHPFHMKRLDDKKFSVKEFRSLWAYRDPMKGSWELDVPNSLYVSTRNDTHFQQHRASASLLSLYFESGNIDQYWD